MCGDIARALHLAEQAHQLTDRLVDFVATHNGALAHAWSHTIREALDHARATDDREREQALLDLQLKLASAVTRAQTARTLHPKRPAWFRGVISGAAQTP